MNPDAPGVSPTLYTQYDNGLWSPTLYFGGPQVFTAVQPLGIDVGFSDGFWDALDQALDSEGPIEERLPEKTPVQEQWAIGQICHIFEESESVNKEDEHLQSIATGEAELEPADLSTDPSHITEFNVYRTPDDADDEIPDFASLFAEWDNGCETLVVTNSEAEGGRFTAFDYSGCEKETLSDQFVANVQRSEAELSAGITTFEYDWHAFMDGAPTHEHRLMEPIAQVMSNSWVPQEIKRLNRLDGEFPPEPDEGE